MKVQYTAEGSKEIYNTAIDPYVLEGDNIKLVPVLIDRDADVLYNTYAENPETFQYFPDGPASSLEEFKKIYNDFHKDVTRLTFTVYDKNSSSERCIGSVQLLEITPTHKRTEIGSIWITYLLLAYAFEKLQYRRVQWKTHHNNIPSQKAAIKLGFKLEGTLRNHIIMYDGTTRHSVYYSIIEEDWPNVKESMDERLAAFKH
jgi:RimJ/RimL family protein N-acetyltransferase